ncbi:MAG: hypothetical protein Q8T13_23825 [Acidobacteriota bacterium]|nr:hypothetical protein [Acidobacteriota bacterium]
MAPRSSAIASGFDRLIRDVTRVPAGRAARDGAGRRPKNPNLEKYQQHEGCKLLSSLGAVVLIIGTRRSRGKPCPKCKTFVPEDQGTRQTPGIPDVLAFLPARGGAPSVTLLWEAKHADGGRLSADQQRIADLCARSGQAYCSGPLDALISWLVANGYLKAENLPHYRVPAGARS